MLAGVQLANPLIYLFGRWQASLRGWGSTLKSLDILDILGRLYGLTLGFNSQIP